MKQCAQYLGWILFVDRDADGQWKAWILDEEGKHRLAPQADPDDPFSEAKAKQFAYLTAWDLKKRPEKVPEPKWNPSPR